MDKILLDTYKKAVFFCGEKLIELLTKIVLKNVFFF